MQVHSHLRAHRCADNTRQRRRLRDLVILRRITHIHKHTYITDKDKQKEIVFVLKRELKMSYHIVDMTDASEPEPVLLSKHAKNLLRFLHLLPARMSSHDNTR